jgi:hypothetical protein
VRNSSLVKWFCAENVTGLKFVTEATDLKIYFQVVGERSYMRRSRIVRSGGAIGSENAGMSNDKASENLARRKPKVS